MIDRSTDEAIRIILTSIEMIPRWSVVEFHRDALIIKAIRKTRLFKFTDDIEVSLISQKHGTLIHARSQSRVGKGDLGQNRRNIRELFANIRTVTGNS